jgi:hypothetical protein
MLSISAGWQVFEIGVQNPKASESKLQPAAFRLNMDSPVSV